MTQHYILLALLSFGIGLFANPTHATPGKAPKTVALLYYAEWCGSCKTLDPKLEEAKTALAEESVLFVTLDHTNDVTSRQAAMMAEALDLGEHYKENVGKTGFVTLVDVASKKAVDRITRETSVQEIEQKIRTTLKN